jgi:hypothetical protein
MAKSSTKFTSVEVAFVYTASSVKREDQYSCFQPSTLSMVCTIDLGFFEDPNQSVMFSNCPVFCHVGVMLSLSIQALPRPSSSPPVVSTRVP